MGPGFHPPLLAPARHVPHSHPIVEACAQQKRPVPEERQGSHPLLVTAEFTRSQDRRAGRVAGVDIPERDSPSRTPRDGRAAIRRQRSRRDVVAGLIQCVAAWLKTGPQRIGEDCRERGVTTQAIHLRGCVPDGFIATFGMNPCQARASIRDPRGDARRGLRADRPTPCRSAHLVAIDRSPS